MKSTRLYILTCGLCAVASATAYAAFYLPETSTRTMQTSPLKPGEAAYVRDPQGTATVYIGGETGNVYRVAEPSGLRGQRVEIVPDAELAVVTENVVASNGAWYAIGEATTGTVVFVTRGGEDIVDYAFATGQGETGPMQLESAIITDIPRGAELHFKLMPRMSGWCCISNIVCQRAAYGDKPFINDLTLTRYEMFDELGYFELGGLRRWAKNLYNGNRGEDWADYVAKNKVNLDSKALRFDRKGRYSLRNDSHTNLVLLAGGNAAMTVAFHGTSTDVDSFVITSFGNRNSTVYITYTIDADEFDVANVGVNAKDDLRDEWVALLPSEFTVSGYNVTIPNQTGPQRFYQLTYNGSAVTEMLEVRFKGEVVVEDALILKGTDNNYYQITVGAGGVISATEVSP